MTSRLRLPYLTTILIVAGALRLAAILFVRSFLHPETWEFGPIAEKIVSGVGYTIVLPNGQRAPSAFEPPAYAYILASFYRIGGQRPLTYLILALVQAALGVLLVYVVYRLADLLLGRKGAVIAAILVAIYPTQVYMCNEFHSINFYIVLEAASVLFLVRYLKVSPSWNDLIAAGFCMGVMMLFRGEAPGLVVLYGILLLIQGGLRAVVPSLVFLLLASACLAPWTLRNYLVFGKFVPVCTTSGATLWIGHNPRADGGDRYGYDFYKPKPPDVNAAFETIPFNRDYEYAENKALHDFAIQYIRTHPRREIELAFKKLFIFFFFDPLHPKGRQPAYWVPSFLLTLLAIGGAIRYRKNLLHEYLFVTASIGFAITVGMAVLVLPRYKIVVDPFFMIFAAALLSGQQPAQRSEAQPTSNRPIRLASTTRASQFVLELSSIFAKPGSLKLGAIR